MGEYETVVKIEVAVDHPVSGETLSGAGEGAISVSLA
jgi:hypothetical protein